MKKNIKTKLIALAGGAGALCALCCTLPIMGLLGFGAIEALVCENDFLQGMGVTIAVVAAVLLLRKRFRTQSNRTQMCAINCGCNAQ
ncbi:MAG: hypothetical protein AB7O96_11270 [Pseudobdellovibrionaceae bacterium]